MKKIPTLFERVFDGHKIVDILPNPSIGMEWVLAGEGQATIKWDGSACAIIDGKFYKRYDAKGKSIPEGAIPCQDEPDPVTDHMPCWVLCDRNNKSDKWFWDAYDRVYSNIRSMPKDSQDKVIANMDATYEAIGKHFNGNPYKLDYDILVRHGNDIISDIPRTFEGIRDYLKCHLIEGIVFWKDGTPQCKIKRSDFGFEWNRKQH